MDNNDNSRKETRYCVACLQEIRTDIIIESSSDFCSICINAISNFHDDDNDSSDIVVVVDITERNSNEDDDDKKSSRKKIKTTDCDDQQLLFHLDSNNELPPNFIIVDPNNQINDVPIENNSIGNDNNNYNNKITTVIKNFESETLIDNNTTTTTAAAAAANYTHNKRTYHPNDIIFNINTLRIPYPKSLSPSSINQFKKCPQSYLFTYLLPIELEIDEDVDDEMMVVTTAPALVKGTLCHAALEHIFDVEPPIDRTIETLHNIFLTLWSEYRNEIPYSTLFIKYDEIITTSECISNNSSSTTTSNNESTLVNYYTTSTPLIMTVRDEEAENIWKNECIQLLTNYYNKENPTQIMKPIFREVSVSAKLYTTAKNHSSLLPSSPSTNVIDLANDDDDHVVDATSTNIIDLTDNDNIVDNPSSNYNMNNEFIVRGIIDRLDIVHDDDNNHNAFLRLIDYKTGKPPNLKYSNSMNETIKKQAFDQLLIYALLLHEKKQKQQQQQTISCPNDSMTTINNNSRDICSSIDKMSIPLRYLRIFYLNSSGSNSTISDEGEDQGAVYWDMDLGATQKERDIILNDVYNDLILVWNAITDITSEQNLKSFYGCNRTSYCDCHIYRSLFPPGFVWEPPSSSSSNNTVI